MRDSKRVKISKTTTTSRGEGCPSRPFQRQPIHPPLDVVAGDGAAARGAAVGEDGAALLDVEDAGAGDADGGAALDGRGAGEGDGVEVGEGHERAARLVVLDDPLGVVLAELARLAAERVRDALARRQVLERGHAGALGGGGLLFFVCVVRN